MAFGALELNHDQFGALTPAEFHELYAGYEWRVEREWERSAWMVSWILKGLVKKAPTPDELLGRKKKKALTPRDLDAILEGKQPSQSDAAFAQLWEKVERQRVGNG